MTPVEQAVWAAYLAKHHKDPGCQSCKNVSYDYELEYPGVWTCGEHEAYGHLKSFPFKKVMPCFSLNFWYSPFAAIIDGSEESEKVAQTQWSAWWHRGKRVEELEAMIGER